eukprot:scaffold2107_cov127-Isochrysis_galbana.AAC.6
MADEEQRGLPCSGGCPLAEAVRMRIWRVQATRAGAKHAPPEHCPRVTPSARYASGFPVGLPVSVYIWKPDAASAASTSRLRPALSSNGISRPIASSMVRLGSKRCAASCSEEMYAMPTALACVGAQPDSSVRFISSRRARIIRPPSMKRSRSGTA